MRVAAISLLLVAAALPATATAETLKNVSLVDTNCLAKVAAKPDEHARSCAILCSTSGYGVINQDGKFLKFDAPGNEKALAALKASNKKDHLRVDVTGELDGDRFKVSSIRLL